MAMYASQLQHGDGGMYQNFQPSQPQPFPFDSQIQSGANMSDENEGRNHRDRGERDRNRGDRRRRRYEMRII